MSALIVLHLNYFNINIVSKKCNAQFLVVTLNNSKKSLTNIIKRSVADVLDTPQIPVDTYIVVTAIRRLYDVVDVV